MTLELEGKLPDWRACSRAAETTGINELMHVEDRFGGQFTRSEMFFGASKRDMPHTNINAEGDHGCSFPVRYTIVFRLNNGKYKESVQDIKDFLTHLSELTPMQFVLSFQYEDVRAIRDHGRGFEFFWDNPR
jgi:hypothetical protein